jgi:hypothetical protein
MPYTALAIRPGINTQATALLNSSGFSQSQLIRFKDGFLQKLGGWMRITSTAFIGICRDIQPFEDLNNNAYIGAGTEQFLYIFYAGNLYNITPIVASDNLSTPFSTTINSTSVTVTDASHNPNVGDWINVINPAAIDDVIILGSYQVVTVPTGTTYTIALPNPATSTVVSGGTAALFTTVNTSPSVQVTLNNHGLSVAQTYTVYISTTVGGFTLLGQYSVATVIDANNFTFLPGGTASSGATASENGGQIEINYQIPSGSSSTTNQSGLYGLGIYGSGPYGTGTPSSAVQARLWSLGVWGQDLLASYTDGTIYVWIPTSGVINNPATAISGAPLSINAGIFVAMPQQQVVALGASVGGGSQADPLLVRWSDISDYTSWTATVTNQAGSFRIPRGSHIVGGMQGPLQGFLWTDVGFWIMQYVGTPFVYGFNEIAHGCGLIGQNAAGILNNDLYWMGLDGFFRFNGSTVVAVPCSVWDVVFRNLNTFQAAKIMCMPNSSFNEIGWAYPSASGTGENDSYVKYNTVDNVWDYGSLVRTAWTDQSIYGQPLGVDGAGLIQQHEISPDADGLPMDSWAQTGYFKIAEGSYYTFLERIIPDFIFSGDNTVLITLYFVNYPNGDVTYTVGPLSATNAIRYLIVRGRGRLVSMKIESNDIGSFWRLGSILYSGAPDGRN